MESSRFSAELMALDRIDEPALTQFDGLKSRPPVCTNYRYKDSLQDRQDFQMNRIV